MAERKTRKQTGKWKIVLAVTAVVMVIIAIVMVAGFVWQERYDDDYFVSDDKKLVIGMNDSISSFESNEEYEPKVTYLVYYYDGDVIDGMKVFFVYDDKESAAVANENITMDGKDWATNKNINNKFIIFDVAENQYSLLKTDDIRKIIEDMRTAGTLYELDVE